MEELMNRISGKSIEYPGCMQDIKELIGGTSKDNYYYCIVYILLLKEQIINIPETERDRTEFEDVFRRLKVHAKTIAGEEWGSMIDNSTYTIYKEEKSEENRVEILINLVIETLIRTSTADMERQVDAYLQEEINDPRTETKTQKNVSQDVIEEILCNLTKLSDRDVKGQVGIVTPLLSEEHIPIILKYLKSLSKVILLSLYLNNKPVYDALQKEFIRKESSNDLIALVDFPEIDIDGLLSRLYKSSSVFKTLDIIIKTRLIHRDKIVSTVIEYIKTGSRTKSIHFIRENLECFLGIIPEIGLGCEEVLLLAERNKVLLNHAFKMMAEIKSEMKDKKRKPVNSQKKEKRLSNLISALASELSNGTDTEIVNFIVPSHEIDADMLSKVCIGLFKAKQPSDTVKEVLSELVTEDTTTSFVFTVMPYLKDVQKYKLMGKYLVDDVSLSLFTRIIKKPEDIFIYAHTLDTDTGNRIIQLCFTKPEIFTDRILSVAIEEMSKMEVLPILFMETVRNSLKLFSNMKPFLVNLIKREWSRLFRNNQNELIILLESIGMPATEILLSIDEDHFMIILNESHTLKKRMTEYLIKQPMYIQNKYKTLLNRK
ncbi:hypothetical protein NEPAR06_0111 [Nematocida parisii]|uniref:uncharacterized protein n=1 Tax=Nematocida parisii (strain ERTm1 / ATCC PRA-289) TaxID=881290 RepID=UPI000264B79B|nr:uncharacterized protein NEPG_00141 [Nematocida parisii ERTm1]EIJ94619.1 hypothetical protein NEPG_00141 [Nematocida parisii ERTm1]KAI5152990.1 hypothetical protein NEPAR06_0111 [Nematocida parisii]KAI5157336.1 hypothetical protein NEPAR05_1201 [Nematocida parisii]|eukprot:XP_013057975.1 hypothetical protein NEPG_00141 [Nematocida parisii ERTm1]